MSSSKVYLLTFLLAVAQASFLVPVFKSLTFSPQIALLFLWISSKDVKDTAVISVSFFIGVFFDALSNTWGAYIVSSVLFTYVYVFLRNTLIVKREIYEILIVPPTLITFYKLTLFLLQSLKTELSFSLKKLLVSLVVEYIFVLLSYKLSGKRS